ncbi:acyl-CoA dehydratase activase-related protein [Wukongibacter baidiensis]|uniref:acyl-CoA dehydratase activase-related protein n=1 Tax=Wukongibacter baidiensis TaxID=1723361 RepID=UPI003D7F3D1C
MSVRVGIPRALLFYEYYPLWISFFESLGAEVVVSRKTNKEILDNGVKNTVDEACIPVKIFHGHVMDLKDRVDYLFIPRIKSIFENEYICPKFSGLPEMIKHSIVGLPRVIDTEINFFQSRKGLNNTIYEIGKYISNDHKSIMAAYDKAYLEYRRHKKNIKDGEAAYIDEVQISNRIKDSEVQGKKVMVLGHPYNIYDSYLNINILDKMKANEAIVLTPEMIEDKCTVKYSKKFDGNLSWTFARKLIGTAMYLIDTKSVDGIIYISTFGCGVDSVVGDLVEKLIRRHSNIPFALVTLDEHSGEAGINTRIEAFMDMIKWRDILENNISAHG